MIDKYQCSLCGHGETPGTVNVADWDKCELCGGQLVRNPEWVIDGVPLMVMKGGATLSPSKSPEQLTKEHRLKNIEKAKAIMKGPGTPTDHSNLINKNIVYRDMADKGDFHNGKYGEVKIKGNEADAPEFVPTLHAVSTPNVQKQANG